MKNLVCCICNKSLLDEKIVKIIEIKNKQNNNNARAIEYVANQEERFAHIECIIHKNDIILCPAKKDDTEQFIRSNILNF